MTVARRAHGVAVIHDELWVVGGCDSMSGTSMTSILLSGVRSFYPMFPAKAGQNAAAKQVDAQQQAVTAATAQHAMQAGPHGGHGERRGRRP